MAFGNIQSTALIPYSSSSQSVLCRSDRPDTVQEYVIRKSLSAQFADYRHLHHGGLEEVFWRLSSPITIVQRPTRPPRASLDAAITDAKNLAHAQLVLKVSSKCLPQYSKIFRQAYRQNIVFLNRTIAVIQASSPADLKDKGEEITDLFFRALPRCNYDRSLITRGSVLESVLDDAVSQAHHQPDAIDPITGKRVHETVAEALFARRLGVRLEKADSIYHSVYYLLNRSKERFTGNNDRHFGNTLLKKVSEKGWDLVAIDNANSFPWCHDLDLPPEKTHPYHWFKWSTLPQSKMPFSDSMVKRINALNIDHLEDIARKELVSQDVPSSEEHIEGKIKTLRDRFDRIKLLANQKASLRAIAENVLTLKDKEKINSKNIDGKI